MKGPLTNEAGMTDEMAKTQIPEQFLTGFRSRDWILRRCIKVSEKRHYKYSLERHGDEFHSEEEE